MNLSRFRFQIFLLIFCLSFYSCKKDASPGKGATFALAATDDNCDLVTAAGIYKIGVPLSSAEKAEVEINVTKPGDYSISTDTLGNIYFAANGTFANTGTQKIELSGYGTPLEIGTYRFSVRGSNLHFSVQVTSVEQFPTEAVPSGVYIKGTLGDYQIDMTFPMATAETTWGHGGSDTSYFMGLIGYGQYPNNPPGTGDVNLTKQYISNFYNSTKEQFKEFFAPKTYPIAFAKCETHISNGFTVGWRGHDGVFWSTKKDYDQTGSYVRIVGIEDGYRNNGMYYVKARCRIKCKMYRFNDDAVRDLNAEMVCYFVRPIQ